MVGFDSCWSVTGEVFWPPPDWFILTLHAWYAYIRTLIWLFSRWIMHEYLISFLSACLVFSWRSQYAIKKYNLLLILHFDFIVNWVVSILPWNSIWKRSKARDNFTTQVAKWSSFKLKFRNFNPNTVLVCVLIYYRTPTKPLVVLYF